MSLSFDEEGTESIGPNMKLPNEGRAAPVLIGIAILAIGAAVVSGIHALGAQTPTVRPAGAENLGKYLPPTDVHVPTQMNTPPPPSH